MNIHTHIEFGKPVDYDYKKYYEVWKACVNANVEIPPEVYDYFDGEEPDGKAIWRLVREDGDGRFMDDSVSWDCDGERDRIIIDLTKVPKNVKLIRFSDSY